MPSQESLLEKQDKMEKQMLRIRDRNIRGSVAGNVKDSAQDPGELLPVLDNTGSDGLLV